MVINGALHLKLVVKRITVYCPVTSLRLKSESKPWIRPRLLEVFKRRDLAHEYIVIYIGACQLGICLLIVLKMQGGMGTV
jgi:hypothetical protein